MKKLIYIICLLALASVRLGATAAYPYPIQVTQPDGSIVTIQLHGDEFYHWTTLDGRIVEKDADGFFRPVSMMLHQQRAAAAYESRSRRDQTIKQSSAMTTGTKRFLVLLIEFADLPFIKTRSDFDNMLNLDGYSDNGGTGSAHEYFYDSSKGMFNPQFDVVGPITVSKGYAAYVDHEGDLLKEACQLIDAEVDFKNYDTDSNGYVDNIFFYFAGHNEAEGATGHIWPHAASGWTYVTCDGKRVNRYACTSELRSASGTTMCGIGTFCHEFGHVLGLPDFYDTDYETNGTSKGLYNASLMSNGNYNNNGRTPPYLSAVERNMLGWMGEPTELTASGSYNLAPVTGNVAYKTPTATSGEYFVYEVRDQTKWDTYIGKGMLIYHIDKSDRVIAGGKTASQRWSSHYDINTVADHPCYCIVEASPSVSFNNAEIYYPGSNNIRKFDAGSTPAALDWDGNPTGFYLSDIVQNGSNVRFTLTVSSAKKIKGKVTTTTNVPIAGASVSISAKSAVSRNYAVSADGSPVARKEYAPLKTVTTASDGSYTIDLEGDPNKNYTITVSKDGYYTRAFDVSLAAGIIECDVQLTSVSEPVVSTLRKYGSLSSYRYGITGSSSITVGMRYSASELADKVGSVIRSISFEVACASASEVMVFVDFGSTRQLTKVVSSPLYGSMNTVDISSSDLHIPSGQSVTIGYAVKNANDIYIIAVDNGPYVSGGIMVGSSYNTTSLQDGSLLGMDCNAIISAEIATSPGYEEPHDLFYDLGFHAIENPGHGVYAAGSYYTPKLKGTGEEPLSVTWYVDGSLLLSSGLHLTAGEHDIMAIVKYSSGDVEEYHQTLRAE